MLDGSDEVSMLLLLLVVPSAEGGVHSWRAWAMMQRRVANANASSMVFYCVIFMLVDSISIHK